MKSATELKEKGAKRVYAFATHGIFSGDFYANLAKSDLEQIFVTDSLAPREEDAGSKVRRVSVSKLLADKIFDIFGK
jgi:ribose-phosphate pyrophosphokinase